MKVDGITLTPMNGGIELAIIAEGRWHRYQMTASTLCALLTEAARFCARMMLP